MTTKNPAGWCRLAAGGSTDSDERRSHRCRETEDEADALDCPAGDEEGAVATEDDVEAMPDDPKFLKAQLTKSARHARKRGTNTRTLRSARPNQLQRGSCDA